MSVISSWTVDNYRLYDDLFTYYIGVYRNVNDK